MSEDNFDESNSNGNGKKDKESDFDKELKKSPLSPVNENLFNFLDSLFTGEGEFPERIEARPTKGRNKDQYGPSIKQYIFKSGSVKPSRERVVMMCNEIMHRLHVQTDVLQRDATYMIGAMHHGRSDDFFEILSLTVKPRKNWKNGDGDEVLGNGDDDEELPFHARYNVAQLGHQERMFGLMGGMIEGLIDRSDRQAQAAQNDAEQMRARYIELLETNLRLVQADDERKERIEKSKMWRENVDKGLGMAWGLLPPMLSAFKGMNANWQPGQESNEAYTLRESFFKTESTGGILKQEEFEFICGKLDGEGTLVTPGVLYPAQVQILAYVAKKEANPNTLDALIPEGEHEIKIEQVMKILAAGISPAVLAPLKALLDVRIAKRAEAQQPPNGKGA